MPIIARIVVLVLAVVGVLGQLDGLAQAQRASPDYAAWRADAIRDLKHLALDEGFVVSDGAVQDMEHNGRFVSRPTAWAVRFRMQFVSHTWFTLVWFALIGIAAVVPYPHRKTQIAGPTP